jgi:hypothetical protein
LEKSVGHIVAKDIYGPLGEKIDSLSVRTPQTEAFHAMLRQLYSTEEAELVVQMPFGLSTLGRIARLTGREPDWWWTWNWAASTAICRRRSSSAFLNSP